MYPMREFDPERPCRLHELVNNKVFNWRAGWAENWRRHAVVNERLQRCGAKSVI
jgi:hypothetical protein